MRFSLAGLRKEQCETKGKETRIASVCVPSLPFAGVAVGSTGPPHSRASVTRVSWPSLSCSQAYSMVVLSPTPPLQDWASQEGKVFLGGPRRVSFVGPQKWELKIKLVFKELTLYLAVTQYTLN